MCASILLSVYIYSCKGEGRRKELGIISRNRRALNRLSPFAIIHNSCRKKGKLFLLGVNRGNSLDFTYTHTQAEPVSRVTAKELKAGTLFQ